MIFIVFHIYGERKKSFYSNFIRTDFIEISKRVNKRDSITGAIQTIQSPKKSCKDYFLIDAGKMTDDSLYFMFIQSYEQGVFMNGTPPSFQCRPESYIVAKDSLSLSEFRKIENLKERKKIKRIEIEERRKERIKVLSNNVLRYGMPVDSVSKLLKLDCKHLHGQSLIEGDGIGWTNKMECDSIIIIFKQRHPEAILVDMRIKNKFQQKTK